jgi:hypothetical protein
MPPLWKPTQIQGRTGARLAIATILCGPIAGVATIMLISVIMMLMSLGSGYASFLPWEYILSGGFFGAVIGWPAMLLFGLPAHALLYRRRSYKLGGYLLAGTILGLLATLFLALIQATAFRGGGTTDWLMSGAWFGVVLVLASVAAASVFWFIRRPDRDMPAPEKLAATFE